MRVLPVAINGAQAEGPGQEQTVSTTRTVECAVRRGASGSTRRCACCLPLSWLLFATYGSR
ncbi:hypothetical protein PMIN01_09775 [Paraphaeosphaeria minitans]|uniref:Uncharacterized protein n=1 Tax=Paraphaeosphaeria minitans TaxID=565426 RepID=A0A9P6KML9_9PLEO|nr:hypothetical protein PMIN01_09775 [Paraphaeosphaeria minitans]